MWYSEVGAYINARPVLGMIFLAFVVIALAAYFYGCIRLACFIDRWGGYDSRWTGMDDDDEFRMSSPVRAHAGYAKDRAKWGMD